jgi:hypothetical protein
VDKFINYEQYCVLLGVQTERIALLLRIMNALLVGSPNENVLEIRLVRLLQKGVIDVQNEDCAHYHINWIIYVIVSDVISCKTVVPNPLGFCKIFQGVHGKCQQRRICVFVV